MSVKLSVLNLVTRFYGDDEYEPIERGVELLQFVEELGYHRYWVAEHHNFKGALSSATAILIQHFLSHSQKIRVGAGGVMLPNHTTLQVAETYGTLDLLYPGRVDLGLGRAPGTDMDTARIIYKGDASEEGFRTGIEELQRYFGPEEIQGKVVAYPGVGHDIPLYILGSSIHSAVVAADYGLPYSFAGHFSRHVAEEAINLYRENFKPSAMLSEPYVIMGILGNAAETKEKADLLYTSTQQMFYNMSKGIRDLTPQPLEYFDLNLTSSERLFMESRRGMRLLGSPEEVRQQWESIQNTYQPDELMIVSYLPTIEDLKTSYKIISDVINIQ